MKKFGSKAAVLLAMVFLLWIAAQFAAGVVTDRLRYRTEAQQSIAASHAGAQILVGPALTLQYEEHYLKPESADTHSYLSGRTSEHTERRRQIVLPESMTTRVVLDVAPLARGLFRVNTYAAQVVFEGHWMIPDPTQLPRVNPQSTLVQSAAPRLQFALGDARGIRSARIEIDGREIDGDQTTQPAGALARVELPLQGLTPATGRLPFRVTLQLNGRDAIAVLPIGRTNHLHVTSNWPHPSFDGAQLPDKREVGPKGFQAEWEVPAIATEAPAQWRQWLEQPAAAANAAGPVRTDHAFGVRLIDPVDIYTLSDRATKYAMLFILLTVGGFACFELFRGLRLHPIQYLMVGLALIVFYLLLLSLSERIGFGAAYALSAAAVCAVVGYYLRFAVGSWRGAAQFGAALIALYGALYGLLHSEQNALLSGSVGLFALLALAMILTRRVDWFELTERGTRRIDPTQP